MTASLAYRKHEPDILAGNPPEKYTRLLRHIPGQRILEVGSAEGVLACLLAKQGKEVTAVEGNSARHAAALALAEEWAVTGVRFVNARIEKWFEGEYDTLVAVRMIYYLRGQIDAVFEQVAQRIPNVVLCGNRNRAARYHAGTPDAPLGEFNYYASLIGMRELLERHGYHVTAEEPEGDAIVVGTRA